MDDLISIENKGGIQMVNARHLWENLGIQSNFRDWISNRISHYGFMENEDFRYFFSESSGGRKSKEYLITLDMAKELCMIERNEIGRKFRKYFIEVEKQFRSITTKQLTSDEVKQSRKDFTSTLIDHGVKGPNIGIATNYQYAKLFGTNAKGIKNQRNPAAKTARELLTDLERTKLVAHEGLARLGAANMQAHGLEPMKYCIREAAELTAAMIEKTTLLEGMK